MELSSLSTFIVNNIPYIILLMTGLLFASLLVFININIKLARMNKRYRRLMTGMDGCNIEHILMGHIDEVREVTKKVAELEQENRRIDLLGKRAIQKISMVRFSAFEGIGGDLSYAIAMLNYQNDGMVLSSIFGREESRCYVKPIVNGTSTYLLTDEEKSVLAEAMKK